jgi:AcrR family transcriptional regulator
MPLPARPEEHVAPIADVAGRPRRSTRDRPAKAPLSEQAIVEAALAITRDEGLDAVTMRRVATELDTGAASLYVYVSNREELLRAMVDRALGSVPLVTPDAARWREQVYELMLGVRNALEAYPGLATVLHEPPTTDNALAGVENLLGVLFAGGVGLQDAAWACDILALITTASAAEADIRRAAGRTTEADWHDAVARMHGTFTSLPPERFPLLVEHADEMVTGHADDRFRFAIETFLDGLVSRAARS